MATFQKRPVEVEIRRAEGREEIDTREGTVVADAADGDLVAEGVNGEVYPIGPGILSKTYVPVDADAVEIYEECLPEGVVVEFEETNTDEGASAVYVSGIWIDGPLDEAERKEAEAFCREFLSASPHLSGEVAYTV